MNNEALEEKLRKAGRELIESNEDYREFKGLPYFLVRADSPKATLYNQDLLLSRHEILIDEVEFYWFEKKSGI